MKPYAIALYDGRKVTLSDKQYKAAIDLWDRGAEEFAFGDQRISRKTIAYIGEHETTGEIKRMQENINFLTLPQKDQKRVKEAKFKKAQENYKKNKKQNQIDAQEMLKIATGQIEPEQLPEAREGISEKKETDGDALYWLDNLGNKHYS